MTASTLVRMVREAGVVLRTDEGRLLARPESALTPAIRKALRSLRKEVIAYIEAEPPREGHLHDGGRIWIPPPERPGWCPCDEARIWDVRTGLCRTCHGAVFGEKVRLGSREEDPS